VTSDKANLLGLDIAHPVVGVCVVGVVGEVDNSRASELARVLRAQLDTHPAALVLDLTRADFFGSAALAVLVNARSFGQETIMALVCATSANVTRKLLRTGVGPLFTVYPTVEDAVVAVSK
jgi:anti-anti-sigma factor